MPVRIPTSGITSITPLRLDRMLTQGYLKVLKITHEGAPVGHSPPKGHAWFVLSGLISHVTGTNTELDLMPVGQTAIGYWLTMIKSAELTGSYPMFNTNSDDIQSQWQPLIVTPDLQLIFTVGHNNVVAYVTVIEWRTQ